MEEEPEINPFVEKFIAKSKQNPFVPIGILATCWAFWGAYRSIRTGQGQRAQKMFRYRVASQFITVGFVMGGALIFDHGNTGNKQSAEEKLKIKSEERKQMWLDELDRQEEELQRRRARVNKSQ